MNIIEFYCLLLFVKDGFLLMVIRFDGLGLIIFMCFLGFVIIVLFDWMLLVVNKLVVKFLGLWVIFDSVLGEKLVILLFIDFVFCDYFFLLFV